MFGGSKLMANAVARTRQDEDILEEVHSLIARYPPLAADRHHLRVSVQGGVALLEGHLKTPITRQFLVERVAALPGVRELSAEALYDDETIRFEVGRRMPDGVLVNPVYGVVVLSGVLPPGLNETDVARLAAGVPGVIKVATDFNPV